MKLDRGTVCADIMLKAIDVKMGKLRPEDFVRWLYDLDLVFKPGDSSHSVLVTWSEALTHYRGNKK